MPDTSKSLDVSTVLTHLQAIFEQEGLADLKITFPYTPTPGSWQAAIQDGGLTGFSSWLLRDSAAAFTKQVPQKASPDASGKKDPAFADSTAGQAQPKNGAPIDPKGSLAADLTEAARHVGQVFRSMLLSQAPEQAAAPAAKQDAPPAVPPIASEALTAFNDMLHRLIPGKDTPGTAQPAQPAQPSGGKSSAPPPPSASKDNPTDWKYWADKGLNSLNQFLTQGIKSISGQGEPSKSSGPSAENPPAKKDQTDKKSSAPPEDAEDDGDKSPKTESDADTDDADTDTDTDTSDSESDGSSSDSDESVSASDDEKTSSDDSDSDTSSAYDGAREHLLDVGEG